MDERSREAVVMHGNRTGVGYIMRARLPVRDTSPNSSFFLSFSSQRDQTIVYFIHDYLHALYLLACLSNSPFTVVELVTHFCNVAYYPGNVPRLVAAIQSSAYPSL